MLSCFQVDFVGSLMLAFTDSDECPDFQKSIIRFIENLSETSFPLESHCSSVKTIIMHAANRSQWDVKMSLILLIKFYFDRLCETSHDSLYPVPTLLQLSHSGCLDALHLLSSDASLFTSTAPILTAFQAYWKQSKLGNIRSQHVEVYANQMSTSTPVQTTVESDVSVSSDGVENFETIRKTLQTSFAMSANEVATSGFTEAIEHLLVIDVNARQRKVNMEMDLYSAQPLALLDDILRALSGEATDTDCY